MFRTVMVPLDGSEFGEQALPMALAVARRADAELEVVHKHVPFLPMHPDGILALDQDIDRRKRKEEQSYLEGVQARLHKAGAKQVRHALLEGPTVDTLCEHARACRADLVVMTTHGRGPLTRFWLGSVADALVRRLPVPVLLVRPQEEPAELGEQALPRHVVLTLDGSPEAEDILEPALELGALGEASFTLLRVVEPVPVIGYDLTGYAAGGLDTTLMDQLQKASHEYLDRVAGRFRARSLRAATRVVVAAPPSQGILDEAALHPQSVIALSTHGRGGLSRLLLGSVADKVIRGATTPVLVHRAPER